MNQPARQKRSPASRFGGPITFYLAAIGLVFSVLWLLQGQSHTLYEQMALQGTELEAATLASVRELYNSAVVARVQGHGVEASHEYRERDKSIPLPATLLMEIGQKLSATRPGARALLLSDYPFPWRKDRPPLDKFEQEALQALRKSPDQPFYRFEDYLGRPALRYATADRMQASCVACHNGRPDSPKRDWREGDVRGIVEIVRPLDRGVAQARTAQIGTLAVLAVLAVVVPVLMWLVQRRLWPDRRPDGNLRAAIIKIAAIIAVSEAIVVALMASIGEIPGWAEALLSAAVVTTVAAPVIYYRAIRPLSAELTSKIVELDNQQRILARQASELEKANRQLAANHAELSSRNDRLSLLNTRLEQANAQKETALREMSTLRDALDRQCICSVADRSGRIVEVNDWFCAISGYSREELLGKNHRIIKSGHHSKEFWADAWRIINSGQSWRGEVCNRRKDGSLYWVDCIIVPLTDANNQITRYFSVRFDITPRKEAEQRLRDSQQRLQQMIDTALDAVVTMDSHGCVTGWNAQAERIFGYTREAVIGRRVSELIIPEETREAHERGLARYLQTGVPSMFGRRTEVTAVGKNGERIPIEMSLNAIQTSTEVWFSAFLQDISERKATELARAQAQIAAEAASRSKSEFLANMSHEIRTPMTAILGYADLLAEDGEIAQDAQRRSELVRIIQRNGEHLLAIINDILDLSKVEAGKVTIERVGCSPAQIIEGVASLMRVKAVAKGIAWNVDYETPLPETIQSDPARLRQILVNLVGNAIKFTEVGGVRLVCRLLDEGNPRLEFDVVDTGIGIAPQQQACLFQPFVQANSSLTRDAGGTGLGLAISKKFAELLGGDVSIVESTPGVGTRIRLVMAIGALDGVPLSLPNQEAALHAPSANTAAIETLPLEGIRILLAEDGPDNQRLISFVLKKAGAQVTVVGNGRLACDEALAAASSCRAFDIILMDMQMPVMDGYNATRLLRSEGYSRPIIALTAHAMSGDRETCLAAGCDDYATKPIHREQLLSVIAAQCRRHAEVAAWTPG